MFLELAAITVSCIIMSLYLTVYILTAGLPTSISSTYYHTENKWLFPVTIASSGIFALVPLMNHTQESYQFVAFFIEVSILFVASAPAFKEELVCNIHAGAALVLGISAIVWLILTFGWPWIAIIGLVVAIIDRKHFLFWVEVGLLYNLYLGLICVIV